MFALLEQLNKIFTVKQNQISLIIIGFILVALMATNPSTDEHKEAIKKDILQIIDIDNNLNSAEQLGEKIGESISGIMIDNMVERENYILFSITHTMPYFWRGVLIKKKNITLGIFGHIFLLKKYDIGLKKYVDNSVLPNPVTLVNTDTESTNTSDIDYNKNSDQKIPDYIASEDDATNTDGDIVGNNDIIGKSIKIGNLEVAQNDFPKEMRWEDAKKACENLGRGWRLPTKEELNTLYLNKDKIGGFANSVYFSSTEYNDDGAWKQSFYDGSQYGIYKVSRSYVRAIRAF